MIAGAAQATTYYIKPAGTDGAGYTGLSVAQAWATPAYAEGRAEVLDGDTISVGAGTYLWATDQSIGAKALTWDAPAGATWQKDAGGTTALVLISGTKAISFSGITFDGGSQNKYVVYIYAGTTTKTWTDCTFANSGSGQYAIYLAAGASAISGLTWDSCIFSGTSVGIFRPTASSGHSRSFDVIDGVFSFTGRFVLNMGDIGAGTIKFTGGSVTNVATDSGSNVWNIAGSADVTISGMNPIAPTGTHADIIGSSGAFTGKMSVLHNTISTARNVYVIIAVGGDHDLLVQDNTISSTWASGASAIALIYAANQPTTAPVYILGNRITTATGATTLPHIMVQSTDGTDGAVHIAGNVCRTRATAGDVILVQGATPTTGDFNGIVIEGNQIFGPRYYGSHAVTLHGIDLIGSWGYIMGNYVNGVGPGIVAKSWSAVGDPYSWGYYGRIANNLCVNCDYGGILIKGLDSCPIESNTIFSASGITLDRAPIGILVNDGAAALSTNVRARWNILYCADAEPLVQIDADCTATSDFNCFWGSNPGTDPTGKNLDFEIGGAAKTWEQWTTAGYDGHSIAANPQWRGVGRSDFRLKKNSPCVNPGNTLRFPAIAGMNYSPAHCWGALQMGSMW